MENMLDKIICEIDIKTLNGSDLAYIGDAYFELFVRTYLLTKGITKPKELHKLCTKYVCAKSHAIVIKSILDKLSTEEIDIFHRGRNYNYKHTSKSSNKSEYLLSSGFEALIGYLFITNKSARLEEILSDAISIIENN